MPPEKISRSFSLNLQRLIAGETVPASAFGNKQQLNKLVEDRAIVRMVTGRNRSSYRCPDPSVLRNYLRLHFGITDLAAYIELLDRDNLDGEDSLQATTSTKMLRKKGLQGFFVKAFSAELKIDSASLGALPKGVEYFVHDPKGLSISPSALVVGVENPECFIKVNRLLHLFPRQELIFVLRYHSNSPVEWLLNIENNYLHFGDFDPAGIAIYCNEYLSRLGEARCNFWVPPEIEKLMTIHGQVELFDRQEHLWPLKVKIQQQELCDLIDLITRLGKGFEQEHLL
ncbi:MAG: hypothetical protein V3V05_02550 [Pontiella sp.]